MRSWVPFFDIFSLPVPVILFLGALYIAFSIFQGRSARDGGDPADPTSSVLKVVYTLTGLIAAFVGFGIEAFYPSPKYPGEELFYGEVYGEGAAMQGGATLGAPDEAIAQEVPPDELVEPGVPPEALESERAYMQQERAYREELSEHQRGASLAAIGAALLLVSGWVSLLRRLPVIGDGLTLGGLLTLLYGLTLEVQVDSHLFRSLVISVSLAVLLVAIILKLRSGDLQNA